MKAEEWAIRRILAADGKLREASEQEIQDLAKVEYSWWDVVWFSVTNPRYVWMGIKEGFKVARLR